jgi:hypothetical protein
VILLKYKSISKLVGLIVEIPSDKYVAPAAPILFAYKFIPKD